MGYSAVLWDFGGVITTSPFDSFNRYEAERRLPENTIRKINATNPDTNAWALVERSEIDAEEFDRRFADEARALGYDIAGRDILALLAQKVRPRMIAALDKLKAEGFRLGCITNNAKVGEGAGMSVGVRDADAVAEAMSRFEVVIESSKAGVRKPDPRIYEMMCEALSVEPQECVYLDDLGINCKPAAKLGMTAIKVTNEDQALGDLGKALGMEFA